LGQQGNVKVDEQADSLISQSEIGEKLRFMNRLELLHRLQLQNHLVLYNQVQPVATVQPQPFVEDRKLHLAPEFQSAKMEFVAKALLISGFQKSRAQLTMHLDGCADNGTGSRVPVFVALLSPGFYREDFHFRGLAKPPY
jgi:hypothetical protein